MRRLLVLLLVFTPAKAPAQRSWAWFLAASPEEAQQATKAIAADSSDALGRMVLAQRSLLANYFGFRVPVSLSSNSAGSASHPSAGIILDARQLARLRAGLPDATVEEVTRFLLAHEWGHMVQFRHIPLATLTDTSQRRMLECEADMIGGSILAMIAADKRGGPEAFRAATHRFIALAFDVGLPTWDFPWMHPSPIQRTVCITLGGVAGMHMAMIRTYEITHDSMVLRDINRSRTINRRLFGPGDSIVPWMTREARAIVTGVPTLIDATDFPADVSAEIRAIARAAQYGADTLRAHRDDLRLSGVWQCAFDDTVSAAQIRCTWPDLASAAVGASVYDNVKTMMRPIMYEVQWAELPESKWDSYRTQTFLRADHKAALTVSYFVAAGTVTATFASIK
jgi:hypothetical protein